MNGSTRNGPGPAAPHAEGLPEVLAALLDTPVVLGRIEQAADAGGAVDEEPAQLPARPAPLALEQAIHEARHEVDVVEAVGDEHLKRLRYDEHVAARHRLEHPAIDAAVEVEHLLVERFPGVVLLVDRVGRLLGSLRQRGAAVDVEQREGARAGRPRRAGPATWGRPRSPPTASSACSVTTASGSASMATVSASPAMGATGSTVGAEPVGRPAVSALSDRARPEKVPQPLRTTANAAASTHDRADATETVAASHVSDPPRSQKIDAQGASPHQYSGTCRGGRWKLRLGGLHRARALCRAHSRAMVVGSPATDRRAD